MTAHADPRLIVAECMRTWRPPPKLTLSEWADRHFYLSAESSAEAGRWKTLPYQREMMDVITDPAVTKVSVMKSARVGFTKLMNAAIGYYMHQDPASILVVQPTIDDAKGYSKEEIAPMLRDCPELARIVFEDAEETGPRDGAQTILHKSFPGGILSMVGANSGAGFRRISRRIVIFDEVDAYPSSAGNDGDPVKLGTKRSEYFWNRKLLAGSTPLVAGASRITDLFLEGDQRRYFVPCPQCGHMAPLVFSGDKGHVMRWPDKQPKKAFFECQKSGCVIEHRDKRDMVGKGEWRASAPFAGHASFHIWAAYSYSPNATWAQLAEEFLEAKGKPEKLRTFVNTTLGETWTEQGEAPDWERLYQRREKRTPGAIPPGVAFLTAGVDVQVDRFVYEVVGWGWDKQSWSVDYGVLMGDPALSSTWEQLDALLARTYPTSTGSTMHIQMMAVDSGYLTSNVYAWCRRYPMTRVIAVKGQASLKNVLVGTPSAVDLDRKGKRRARGYKIWPVGVDLAKSELYGWLRLKPPVDGEPFPPGYLHFPEYDPEYFRQLTAEQLMSRKNRSGFTLYEWEVLPGRQNHVLDCRVYNRAAASRLGLDQPRVSAPNAPMPQEAGTAPAPVAAPPPVRAPRADRRRERVQGGWLGRRR